MHSGAAIRKSRYAFITLPNYSLIALANAVEPLRMANSLSGQNAYEALIVSLDGAPVAASNGLKLTPTVALADIGRVDIAFVCGGINIRDAVSRPLISALRRLRDLQIPLGALCSGGYALARAGLLAHQRSALYDRPRPLHLLGRHRAA